MKNQDKKIERCNLTRQVNALLPQYIEEVTNIFQSGKYVLGHKLQMFERTFAQYVGTTYGVGVASGTDALYLSLRVLDIGMGDEVITTPFTAVPTISAIIMTGAKPIFADVDPDTFTIAPESIEKVITKHTKAIIPVHLYGLMADMNAIMNIGNRYSIPIIEDAAQAHGSSLNDRQAGSIGLMGCFSFYPTKNLGGFGDGGLITTNNKQIFDKLILLRNYGQTSPYTTIINGVNTRLDEIQAALLLIKLPYLDAWNQRRNEIANIYTQRLTIPDVKVPVLPQQYKSNYHIFTITAERRDALWRYLEDNAIQSNVYYPIPNHLQESNKYLGYKKGDFPVAESLSDSVIALPMFPELEDEEVNIVIDRIHEFYGYDIG